MALKESHVINLDGQTLSSSKVYAIANGEPTTLDKNARTKMLDNVDSSDSSIHILHEKRKWLTGHSSKVNTDITEEFILGHCAGVGEPLSEKIVRAAMAARANVLATGLTGSRPIAAEKLIEMLNKNIHPNVPSQGSVGAAGDLAPMAHIARTLCGYDDAIAGFSPLTPTPKEALALINGVSLSSAIGAIAVERSRKVLQAAIWSAALTMEAIHAQSSCLDERALRSRGHREVSQVGTQIRAILKGSQRVTPSKNPDAFSIRAGPSVMGAVLRTFRFAEEEVNNELNGASDNPLYIDGEWLETGNFHGASIGMAMDHLKVALCQLGTLSERRTFRLTHGKLSNNLPSFLVQGSGLNSGFMLAQYTAAALASEVKGYAHPASADTIPTVQHHEDHVSMSPIAGRMALKALECVADIVAIELLVGAQALDLRIQEDGLPSPPTLHKLHMAIRQKVEFWEDDKVLHPAISAMSEMVRSGSIFSELQCW
jgi:histidine ammonia-lyase